MVTCYALAIRSLCVGEGVCGVRVGTNLCAGDVVDLCCQRLGQRLGEQAFGSLNAEIDDLSVQLVVLLLQTAVILRRESERDGGKASSTTG